MLLAASVGEDILRAVLQGLPSGTVYALVALGFVLTYKTSGVFNFAFGAQAFVSAAMYYQAREEWGWEIVPALIVSVLLVAPVLGLFLERVIFNHLRTSSQLARLVVALGLTIAIPSIYKVFAGFEAVVGRAPTGIVPDGDSVFYDPFGVYRFSRNELVAMVVAIIGMAMLALIFRFTSIGLRMRAVVESPRMTELNGIAADRVSAFAWALSSLFAGVAGVLIAPRFNTLAPSDFFHLMVVAIAAAAVGRLTSLPMALVGGLGLGVFIAELTTFLPRWSDDYTFLVPIQDNLTPAIPFVVLFGVLVFTPGIGQSREISDPLSGVDPPPPSLAAESRSAALTRATRVFAVVFFAITGFVVFTQADAYWLNLVTQTVVLSIIFLSITVVTGMAGQISLCQGAFAAIGGFTVFQLAERYDLSVLVAAVIGALLAAGVAAALSLPVRRIGGIWVAIATLAFAYFFLSVMVKFSWGGGNSLLTGTRVPRPVIGPIDFADRRAFLVLSLIVLILVSLAVIQLREGTIGQTLQAVRGSELAAQSIGISLGHARLVAFAVSGFIAGLGGAMLSISQGNVNYGNTFAPFSALFWLVVVVSLGSRTVEGAIQAAAAFGLFDAVILNGALWEWLFRGSSDFTESLHVSPQWRFILFGLATIQFARHPEGLVENGKRQAARRTEAIMARRNRRKGGLDGDGGAPSASQPAGAAS